MIAFVFVNTVVALSTVSSALRCQSFGNVAAATGQLVEADPFEAIRRIACPQMSAMCAG